MSLRVADRFRSKLQRHHPHPHLAVCQLFGTWFPQTPSAGCAVLTHSNYCRIGVAPKVLSSSFLLCLCSVLFELDKNEITLGPKQNALLCNSLFVFPQCFLSLCYALVIEHIPIGIKDHNPDMKSSLAASPPA